ncbi:MAG TPA: hypothetical protein V6D14_25225 [Coleofasciculaceae cyanobacterium]
MDSYSITPTVELNSPKLPNLGVNLTYQISDRIGLRFLRLG